MRGAKGSGCFLTVFLLSLAHAKDTHKKGEAERESHNDLEVTLLFLASNFLAFTCQSHVQLYPSDWLEQDESESQPFFNIQEDEEQDSRPSEDDSRPWSTLTEFILACSEENANDVDAVKKCVSPSCYFKVYGRKGKSEPGQIEDVNLFEDFAECFFARWQKSQFAL